MGAISRAPKPAAQRVSNSVQERGLEIGVAHAVSVISGGVVGTDRVLCKERQVGAQAQRPLGDEIDPVIRTQCHDVACDLADRSRFASASRRGPVFVAKLEQIQRADEILAVIFGLILGACLLRSGDRRRCGGCVLGTGSRWLQRH